MYYIVTYYSYYKKWGVVSFEFGSRSLYGTYKDYESAYNMAKALGCGKEPKVEQ